MSCLNIEKVRLKKLSLPYWDFEERKKRGILVTLDAAAPFVEKIFHTLFDIKFPLACMQPIDIFGNDDTRSMASNNTVCYHDRHITGGREPSLHAYGLAIDINPIQNPYVFQEGSQCVIQPQEGRPYVNRLKKHPAFTDHIKSIFQENGFHIWGGDWKNPLDYQHFQVPRSLAERLIQHSAQDAKVLFERHVLKKRT